MKRERTGGKRNARKTAREKLDVEHPSHGKAFPIPPAMRRSLGEGTMIVPRPLDVEAMMRVPRKGKVITTGEIRRALARRADVDACCPLTTGIFARLAAEAAEEDAAAGRKRVTPWWRTVRDDGSMNDRFPGGGLVQARRLRREGVQFAPGKGKLRIRDLERRCTSVAR